MKVVKWNEEFGTGGECTCTCDNCGKEQVYKFKSHPYKETMSKLKKKGWLSRKLGDQWYDLCSDKCFEEFR